MEVRKRQRSTPPAMPTPGNPTLSAPGAPAPEKAERLYRFYDGWQEDIGTERDPIVTGAIVPGDMIRYALSPLPGHNGDSTMGFLLRLNQSTVAIYTVSLEGRLVFFRKHPGSFDQAAEQLRLRAGHIASVRQKMKNPAKHY